jgi:small subunit ribosomal protein S13
MEIALTYIHGIGRSTAQKILKQVGVDLDTKSDRLSESEAAEIRKVIDQEYSTEGNLRREALGNIKELMDLGCYRGLRHKRSLPVRGQRTSTNARTRKGPRRRMIGKRKQKSG